MSKDTQKQTVQKSHKESLKSDKKQARLAEALRANLRRRKTQIRSRADTEKPD